MTQKEIATATALVIIGFAGVLIAHAMGFSWLTAHWMIAPVLMGQ